MILCKVGPVFRRLLSVLLITLLITSAIPISAAHAEEPSTQLDSNPEQAAQAAAMGLSTDQPNRISPSGKVIDKSKSPLGSNLVVMNKIYQLSFSYTLATSGSAFSYQGVVNNPISGTSAQVNASGTLSGSPGITTTTWAPFQQVTVGADTNGDGLQELVTVGLVTLNSRNSKLEAKVTDFNRPEGAATSEAFRIDLGTNVGEAALTNTTRMLEAVSGDFNRDGLEDVAVVVLPTGKVHVFTPSMTGCTVQSTRIFSGLADMEALDVNKDGFPELLITIAGNNFPGTFNDTPAELCIFSDTNLSGTYSSASLKSDAEMIIANPQVDMGNAFGSGEVIIVTGNNKLTYLQYDPVNETYTAPLGFFSLADEGSDLPPSRQAVKLGGDVKCASLGTPVPGNPEYVTIDGFIFLYDKTTSAFTLQEVNVTTNSNNVDGINGSDKSHHNITNVNKDNDSTWIFQTLVGNFDGNTEGKEQIIMLHYNKWHHSEFLYISGVRKVGNEIKVHLGQQWKDGSTQFPQGGISAPYILDRGVTLEFLPERSEFAFANPVIMAVLGASPYYEELKGEYEQLGNAGTTFGTGVEVSGSEENSFKATAGVVIGFEQGASVLGVQIFSVEFETKISASFTAAWSTSTSVSKSTSFTSYSTQDGVVLMVVPYDVYVYKATIKDATTGEIREDEMVVEVPYEPRMTMMPLDEYNRRAVSIAGAPIAEGVLTHTIGDPRTYPSSSTSPKLSNLTGDAGLALTATAANASEASAFVASGIGDGVSEQAIDSTHTEGKKYELGVSVEMEYKVAVAGVALGYHGGLEYTRTVETSMSTTTTRQGVVANVPTAYSQYQFNWALVVYNYQLTTSTGAEQTFPVVTYMVKMDGEFPPRVPANFALDSQTLGANVLKWDRVQGALGYYVLRSDAATGSYSQIANLTNDYTTTYTDNGLAPNTTYYYKVWSYNSKDGIESAALPVTSLYVTGMSISTQPKLTYEEGEALDLSAMVVTLQINNDTTAQVAQTDAGFATDFTTSLEDGVALAATDSGSAITVTYTPGSKSVNSGVLTVNAGSPYDFGATVAFKVGSTANATALTANQILEAAVNLTNKTTTAQNVIVILALYSDQGNMVQIVHTTKSVAASGTDTATLTLTLPAGVSGYTAKILIWDGASLTSTTLTPKAPIVRIPA